MLAGSAWIAPYRDEIISHCADEQAEAMERGETYFFPGWRAMLERYQSDIARGRPHAPIWRGAEKARMPSQSAAGPKVLLYEGDNLSSLRAIPQSLSADVCITSPPYFQKFNYQQKRQHGLESCVVDYLRVQVSVFREVQRHLRDGGTCFIVIGDTSNNYSPVRAKAQRKRGDKCWLIRRSLESDYREKETLNVPFRLAEALRRDGWIHRATLIWDKAGGSAVANSDTAPECQGCSTLLSFGCVGWVSPKCHTPMQTAEG